MVKESTVDGESNEATPNQNPQNPAESRFTIREILESAFKIQNDQMDKLNSILDEMKQNSRQYLVVHKFLASQPIINDDIWSIALHFKSPNAFYLWRACFQAAILHFGITENALSSLPQLRFVVDLSYSEMCDVFAYLKVLADRTHFEKVDLVEGSRELLDLYGTFFDGSRVKTCYVNRPSDYQQDNFGAWIVALRMIRPFEVVYARKDVCYDPRLVDFILLAADIVERLSVGGWEQTNGEDKRLPLDVVREILNRKCRYLHIGDKMSKVSEWQVQELIQNFESAGKRVSLAIPTDGTTNGGRLGEYIIQTDFFNKFVKAEDLLLIEHAEMDPKAEDDERIKEQRKYRAARNAGDNVGEMNLNEPSCMNLPDANVVNVPELTDQPIREMLRIVHDHDKALMDEILDFEKELANDISRSMKVYTFKVCAYTRNFCNATFSCEPLVETLWKHCIIWAISTFYGPDHAISVVCWHRSRELNVLEMAVILTPDDLIRLGKRLECLIDRTTFVNVAIKEERADVMAAFTTFLEGIGVKVFSMLSDINPADRIEIGNFEPWLRIVKAVRPTAICYTKIKLTQGLIEFLIKVAEIVEFIRIRDYQYNDDVLSLFYIKEIFKRKCNALRFKGVKSLSFAQIEDLVKFFHQIGKKVSLVFPSQRTLRQIQIGQFVVRTPPLGFGMVNTVHIRHVEVIIRENE